MRSSQPTAGRPVWANFLVQKVLPAPDIPIKARRRGSSNRVVMEGVRYDSAAPLWAARQHSAFGRLAGSGVTRAYLTLRTGCAGSAQVLTLARLLLLVCNGVKRRFGSFAGFAGKFQKPRAMEKKGVTRAAPTRGAQAGTAIKSCQARARGRRVLLVPQR